MPKMVLLGAAGQFGIYGVDFGYGEGYPLNQAASIGVIGAIDGPTAILWLQSLRRRCLAIAVAARFPYEPGAHHPTAHYAPDDNPERKLIRMEYAANPVSP